MKKSILFLTAILFFASGNIIAQKEAKKAKIYIKKSENGNVTEYEEEVPIVEGQDLQELLNEMDIWKEFEDLKVGETIELNVNRFENGDWQNALNFAFTGEGEAKPFLGVMIAEAENGVAITEIIEETAAAESELRSGDVITKINKEEVSSVNQLIDMIREHEVGEKVTIHYQRDGKENKTKIELGQKDEHPFNWDFNEAPFHGENLHFEFPNMEELEELKHLEELEKLQNIENLIELEKLEQLGELGKMKFMFDGNPALLECDNQKAFLGVTPGESVERGVMISKVVEESSAETIGLKSGDVILNFDGTEVNEFDQLAELIGSHKIGDTVELLILRDGEEMQLSGELGSRNFGMQNDVIFFKDFKGTDENGDQLYEFELDMDADDFKALEEEMKVMKEELQRFKESMEADMASTRVYEATIEISNISEEEAARINENADEKLSIKDDLEMGSFSFFPNPSSGEFNLKFELPEEGDLIVMIYDQSGAIVYNEKITRFSGIYNNIIDLSMYSDGIYYMQVIQNEHTFSKKLVKGS